tara:strand:+ start:74 stop:559 length:486 start_codon:yes stop_codon:yes gene_type:complete
MHMHTPSFYHTVAAAIVVDAVCLAVLLATGRGGARVREYYQTYGAGAALVDVATMAGAAHFGLRAAPRSSPLASLALAVAMQQANDLLLGRALARTAAPPASPILALFQAYAEEVGTTILAVDAVLVAGAVLGAHALVRLGDDGFVGAAGLYVLLMLVYSV